jgi:hypothetical protein
VVELRIDVSAWEHVRVEPRGATSKEWLREPGGSSSRPETDWLFKAVVQHENGSRQAGDFTEVLASRVATLLDLPAAETRLASLNGVDGVIVRNVKPAGFDMVTGRLAMLDSLGVATTDSRRDRSASLGHTLNNVLDTLHAYAPPPQASSWDECTGADTMAAYLVLDALIGNTDRHEQNWSVLRNQDPAGRDHLSATYDLGASLGFQLTDVRRGALLSTPGGLAGFAERGLARRFDEDRTSTLLELARKACAHATTKGQDRIRELVARIGTTNFETELPVLNGMSEVARNFAWAVLNTNGRRISDASWT